jgi:TRAP-type transport system periplasmic protein
MRRLAAVIFLGLLLVSILAMTACGGGTTTTPASSSSAPKAPAATTSPSSAVPVTSAPAASTASAPTPKIDAITLRAVTHLPRTNPNIHRFNRLAEEVQKRTNGQVILRYLGGPEVMPAEQLPKAVQSGVFDMGMCVYTHYEAMGITSGMISSSRLTAEQEAIGTPFANLVQDQHNKIGLYHLGRMVYAPDEWFRIWSKKAVSTPKDLAGFRIGGIGSQHFEGVKALGGVPMMVQQPDMYTALERGIDDAVALPQVGIFYDQSLYEVCKYAIEYPFFNCSTGFIINLSVWNKISKENQDAINKANWDTVLEHSPYLKNIESQQRKDMTAKGLKYITFSAEDAKSYLDTIYKAEWASQLKASPEAQKFYDMYTKK